ncbi:MAG: O-antigen ligase family protein [Crocinitomicaceae bacterium]|nr:O-antigen ligase family protein [Crocinitomicaceae bacterium]
MLLFQLIRSRYKVASTFKREPINVTALLLAGAVVLTTLTGSASVNSVLGAHARYNGTLTYITLILIFVYINSLIPPNKVNKVLRYFYYLALLNLSYCSLQYLRVDPVNWNLPFNRVVGLLGNPDFASALLGLSAIVFCYFALIEKKFKWKWTINIFFSVVSVFLTFATNARQGTGIVFLAFLFLLLVLGFKYKTKIGFLLLTFTLTVLTVAILGMLKIGPLSTLLYKDSITYRGDYWRAAIAMFQAKPIFGVGFGRYGDYFRQFRDLEQVSRRGPSLVSDQAHSIPLDFLSSGGLVLFLIYLVFVFLICRMALVSCIRANTKDQIFLAITLASLWFGYLAQALISIDQIGLAIWGWVFAALVTINYRNYNDSHESLMGTSKPVNRSSTIVAFCLCASVFMMGSFTLFPIWRADTTIRLASAYGHSASVTNELRQQIVGQATKSIASRPLDFYYYRQSGVLLANYGEIDSSLSALKRAIELNPQDSVSFAVAGSILRQTGKPRESLKFLQKASLLDPLNQMNFYELLQSYLALNNIQEANAMLVKMRNISNDSSLYFEAVKILKNGK